MICPNCRTQNLDIATHCKQCGHIFARLDEKETLGGPAAAAPGVAATAAKPALAINRAPGSGRSSPSGFSQALEPGTELGPRFRVESLIGQGGMGRVYKVYDKELGRTVALKILRPELMSDPAATLRFKQELLLASKISHKNILRIHDIGEADAIKFISMAYVEGEDLHHLLKEQGRLPVERALRIAQQLCEALEAAHAEGVVHRDLKPQNILLGKGNHIYVSDFGLAKSLEESITGLTRTGAFMGTPRYMAPEQVEGKPVDHRTDLYALGLILYEMVTGDVPFTGDSTLQVMYQRVKERPKNPKLANPDLPDYLARIILRCLEKDPAHRYQNARDVLADLQSGRAPAPSRQFQISLPEFGPRGWLLSLGALAVVLAAVFAIPSVRHSILPRPASNAVLKASVPPLSEGKFVAVLPLRILGDQASLGYAAEGLVEALSAKLFQLKSVRMASARAAEKIDAKEPLDKTARDLGVNLIVHGMVQGSREKMRIIINLEDVADGNRLWSQEFSGVAADLLTLEDQIYARLANALDVNPSNEELAHAASHPTESIEAYDLYLKGRNAMRNQQDVRNVQAAIQFYDKALQKDPRFALAYAGIADASLVMYREKKDSFWAQKAQGAAQQALQLNASLPEVHFSLGSVDRETGKSAEAIAELKRALELAPNSDEGYRRLASAFLAVGRKLEALQAYEKAVEINPYYWDNYNALGNAYFRFGEYDKALSAFHRVTELEPDNVFGYLNIGAAYFQEGKYEQCIPAFQKALQIQPHYGTYSNLGTVYFYLKRYDDAVKMFEKAVEMNPSDQLFMGNLADGYRGSGQREKAMATYDKAIALAYKELEVNPRNATTMGYLALYYAKKDEPARALDFIRRARAIDPNTVRLIYVEAVVQCLANRPSEAIRSLQTAFQKGYPAREAENDPDLNGLRTNRQFERLIREFGGKPS